MNALQTLMSQFGTALTSAEVAAILGWPVEDARGLLESSPELARDEAGRVAAPDLYRFLELHHHRPNVDPFVPTRRPGLPPLLISVSL